MPSHLKPNDMPKEVDLQFDEVNNGGKWEPCKLSRVP